MAERHAPDARGASHPDDLAVANPGEPVAGARCAGAVTILHGGSGGLTAERAQQWTRASAGIRGGPEQCDWLGTSLASADYGRSTHDDLAIRVAHEASDRAAMTAWCTSSTGEPPG